MSVTVTAPQVALFNTNTVYSWSSGETFNGFLLVELLMPAYDLIPTDDVWAEVTFGNMYPSVTLPRFSRVPIVQGQANGTCGLFLNNQITPPNSKYVVYFYDATGKKIAGPSASFSVTSTAAFSPPVIPVLTAPDTVGSIVVPD